MAVHIPLSGSAQQEAIDLMLPTHNLLKPADGSPITVPNKEMVVGCYYLTTVDPSTENADDKTLHIFADSAEAIYAYQSGKVPLRTPLKIRRHA